MENINRILRKDGNLLSYPQIITGQVEKVFLFPKGQFCQEAAQEMHLNTLKKSDMPLKHFSIVLMKIKPTKNLSLEGYLCYGI